MASEISITRDWPLGKRHYIISYSSSLRSGPLGVVYVEGVVGKSNSLTRTKQDVRDTSGTSARLVRVRQVVACIGKRYTD